MALSVAAAAGVTFTTIGLAGHGGDKTAQAADGSAISQTTKQGAPENAQDLNGDGYPDEVFTSTTGTNTQGGHPYLGIVYGSRKGPDPDNRVLFSQKLLHIGGYGAPLVTGPHSRPATGDLDGDGHPDVVVNNDATVVWGGAKGPQADSPVSKIQLPNNQSGDGTLSYEDQPVTGDFDGDGHLDLADVRTDPHGDTPEVVVMHGPFTRDGKPASSDERPTKLPDGSGQIGGVSTGDANGDKATDLVVHEVSDDEDASSVLLYGGAKTATGLSDKARKLPGGNEVAFGDFDGDKRQDMVVGNSGLPNDEDSDPQHVPGWINVYYGKDPDTAHRITGSKKGDGFGLGLTPADVDGDGDDDLAVELGSNFTAGDASIQVLHGSAKGLGSKPWRSTRRASAKPKDDFDAQLYHAEDFQRNGKDEIVLVDNLYTDPKLGFWYTGGTDKNDAEFSTATFQP